MDAINLLTQDMIRKKQHKFSVGDTVRVHVRIKEGERQRIQVFEGTVIARQHGGVSETFTVRRTSYGVGVERVFPINSPNVEKVEIVRHGKVRRAKLYYLRDRVGKAAKVRQQIVARSKEEPDEIDEVEEIAELADEAVDAAEATDAAEAAEEAVLEAGEATKEAIDEAAEEAEAETDEAAEAVEETAEATEEVKAEAEAQDAADKESE